MATPRAATGDGALSSLALASGWTPDVADLLLLVHPTLRPAEVHDRPELGAVSRAVAAYHEGDLYAVADVPVRQAASPFLGHAWEVLRTVPPLE